MVLIVHHHEFMHLMGSFVESLWLKAVASGNGSPAFGFLSLYFSGNSRIPDEKRQMRGHHHSFTRIQLLSGLNFSMAWAISRLFGPSFF